jgi:hypothetical protein
MTAGPKSHRPRGIALVVAIAAVIVVVVGAVVASARGKQAKAGSSAITASASLGHATVRAGGSLRGKLVFDNAGSTVRVLLHGCKTDGLFAMALRAHDGSLDNGPAFSLVGCDENISSNELVAKPGSTAYSFEVRATYTECGQDPKDQQPKTSKYWTPLCLKDQRGIRDVMPPLPAGPYKLRFVPNGKWTGPSVKPVSVSVTG